MKIDKSKVAKAYVTTDGEVVSENELLKFAEKASKRLIQDQFNYSAESGQAGLMQPNHSLETLSQLLEWNTFHNRAVRTKARDTAGLGWKLQPKQGIKNARVSQKKVVEDFLYRNGVEGGQDNQSLTEAINNALVDYGATGNGYLEVQYNADGLVEGLTHIPAHTVRRHADTVRYAQQVMGKIVWFKAPHMKMDVDYETGTMTPLGSLPFERRANGIIHFFNYSTFSDYYGSPDILPAMDAMLSDKEAMKFNIDFFQNHAVPAYAVTVTGTELDADATQTIKHFFQNEIKKGRHSTLVLTAQKDPDDPTAQPVEFNFQKLSADVQEGSFRLLREDNRNEILTAHGIPGYRIGIQDAGALGGNIAVEATEIYKTSVIEPIQKMVEDAINKYVVWNSYAATDWEFKFEEIDTKDEEATLEYCFKMFEMGALSPNEVREHFGLTRIEARGMDDYYVAAANISNPPEEAVPQPTLEPSGMKAVKGIDVVKEIRNAIQDALEIDDYEDQ